MRKMYLLFAAVLLCFGTAMQGQTILSPKTVTWHQAEVSTFSPSVADGAGYDVGVNRSGDDAEYAVIKFDATSLAGVNIQNARLDLTVLGFSNFPNGGKYYVYALKSDWDESTVTMNTLPQMETIPFDSVRVSAPSSTIKNFKITLPNFTTQLKKWVNTPASNFGFILMPNKSMYGGIFVYSDDSKTDSLLPNLVVNSNGTAISGKVTDSKTKNGFAGIILRAYDADKLILRATDTTDANGNYRLNTIIPGTFVIKQEATAGYRVENNYTIKLAENNEHVHNFVVTADSRAVAGAVKGTWQSDTIFIVGKVTVAANDTLIVKPGTVVQFDDAFVFESKGTLIANGTAASPILWTSRYTSGSKGQGLSLNSAKPSSFIHNTFEYQFKPSGGALYTYNTKTTIENCTFRYNSCNYIGGGLYYQTNADDIIIKNCKVYNNYLNNVNFNAPSGAGIYCGNSGTGSIYIIGNLLQNNKGLKDTYSGSGGGGASIAGTNVYVANNTVVNNFAGQGAGILIKGSYKQAQVYNNVLFNNRGSIDNDQITFRTKEITGTLKEIAVFANNVVEDAAVGVVSDYTKQNINLYNNNNNISAFPQFADSTNNNFQLKGNSHAVGSGLINALTEANCITDMNGNDRLKNGKIDRGCFEYMGNIENRLPLIDSIKEIRIFPNDVIGFTIPFTEIDKADLNTFSITSDNANVKVISNTSNTINQFSIQAINNWEGTALLTATVKDTSNKVIAGKNQRIIKIIVSKDLCGSYSQNITLQGTLTPSCTITIEEGATLTIKPGTKILFAAKDSIIIKGRIVAEGTANDSIIFDLNDTTKFATGASWGSIVLMNPNNDQTSSFAYCRFSHSQLGALTITEVKDANINHCVFSHNNDYAPIRSLNAIYSITNTNFIHNISTKNYPIVYADDSKVVINKCRFINNSTNNSLINSDGYSAKIKMNKSYFSNNTTGQGVVYALIGGFDVYNSVFEKNTGGNGGVVYALNGSPRLFNCTFVKNTAQAGGVIYTTLGTIAMTNCILYGNTATDGKNVWSGNSGRVTFTNSLIEGGLSSMVLKQFDTVSYNKSNNIEVAPDFADYAKGDYSLNSTSPCVNKGAALADTLIAYDYKGLHRQYEPDMGAIEYVLANSKPESIELSKLSYNDSIVGKSFAKILATDNDPWDALTISLSQTLGENNNNRFAIRNDSLVLASMPENTYSANLIVELTASDYESASITKQFTIAVKLTISKPTAITLSSQAYKSKVFGQKFATITATCGIETETATVSLTETMGANANKYFAIDNNNGLTLNTVPMKASDTTLVIEITATNSKKETLTKQFTITVHIEKSTDFDNTEANANLKLWPVPAQNTLNLSGIDDESIENIYIQSVTGQKLLQVSTGNSKTLQFDVSALPSGVYFVRCGNAVLRFVR